MKGKIKILSLLLALAMVTSMFVSCKKEEEDKPATGTDRKEVELSWYQFGDEPKNAKPVQDALNVMSKEDIQTTIDFKWTTGDDQKLRTLMSTGGEYDIVFTCSWFANYVVAAQGGQLADLTEKLPVVTPELWKGIAENIWDGTRIGGKIYAVPVVKDTAATQFWLANKEYVIDGAKAETEFKATSYKLSSMTPLLEKVKAYADAGHPYPHDLTAPFHYNWAGILGINVGYDMIVEPVRLATRMDDPSAKLVSLFEDPDFIETLKTLKYWYDNGLVNKDATETELESQFLCVNTQQGYEGAEISEWGLNKDYTVVINKRYGPVLTTAYIQGAMNGVGVNSKDVDRSLEYLQYMNTDLEYRNMLAFGIEGTNWKLDDGYMKPINDEWAPALWSQATTLILYPTYPAPKDMYKKLQDANNAAVASPLVGFNPDLSGVENEVAACTSVYDANYRYLQTGNVKDVDAKIAELLKLLNDAGYEKIKTTVQTQINEFLAAK